MRGFGRLWSWLDRQGEALEVVAPPDRHVIIAGAGRVGHLAGRALEATGTPFVYIESNLDAVHALQRQGVTAYWGDASSIAVLRGAGIDHALLLILAVPDADSAALAAKRARECTPGIPIVARAHSVGELEMLRHENVEAAIVPEFEGAVVIVRESLTRLGVTPAIIEEVASDIRAEEYDLRHIHPNHSEL